MSEKRDRFRYKRGNDDDDYDDDDDEKKTTTKDDEEEVKTKSSSTFIASVTSQTTPIITSIQVSTTTSAIGGTTVPITGSTLLTSITATPLSQMTTAAIATVTSAPKENRPSTIATTPVVIPANSSTSKGGIQGPGKGLSGSSIALIVIATAGGAILLVALIFILLRRSSSKKRALSANPSNPIALPTARRSNGGLNLWPLIFPSHPTTNKQYVGGTADDMLPAHPNMMPATGKQRRWSYRTNNTDTRQERLDRVRNDLLQPKDLAMRDDLAVGASAPAMTSGITGRRGGGKREAGAKNGDVILGMDGGSQSSGSSSEVEEGRLVIEAGGTWKEVKVVASRESGFISEVREGDRSNAKWKKPLGWLEGDRKGGGKNSNRGSISTIWK